MSRIGNRTIVIPEGVTVTEDNKLVTVKGPKGELTMKIANEVDITIDGNEIKLAKNKETKVANMLHGTMNANLNNLIEGVKNGFSKKLEIIGVGYKFAVKGNTLVINAGYSHPVELNIPTGFGTMLLAHIIFCIPYVILSIMPKLRQLDDNLAEAALDLGCTPFEALYKVIIPQIKEGIVSGALIAFTMSFDDFVISYFTTGPGVSNISIMVYSSVKRINPSINALSTLIVVAITIILIVKNLLPQINNIRRKKHEKAI